MAEPDRSGNAETILARDKIITMKKSTIEIHFSSLADSIFRFCVEIFIIVYRLAARTQRVYIYIVYTASHFST